VILWQLFRSFSKINRTGTSYWLEHQSIWRVKLTWLSQSKSLQCLVPHRRGRSWRDCCVRT